jgi:hypothetical protein
MPIGQPNSTVLMSIPMVRRSSLARLLSQSRTGSLPDAALKKTARSRFPSLSDCTIIGTLSQRGGSAVLERIEPA